MRRETITRPRWRPEPRRRRLGPWAVATIATLTVATTAAALTRPRPTLDCTPTAQPTPGEGVDYRGGSPAGRWIIGDEIVGYALTEDSDVYRTSRCAVRARALEP